MKKATDIEANAAAPTELSRRERYVINIIGNLIHSNKDGMGYAETCLELKMFSYTSSVDYWYNVYYVQ